MCWRFADAHNMLTLLRIVSCHIVLQSVSYMLCAVLMCCVLCSCAVYCAKQRHNRYAERQVKRQMSSKRVKLPSSWEAELAKHPAGSDKKTDVSVWERKRVY